MQHAISKNYMNTLTMALTIANALIMAIADKKLTAPEIIGIVNSVLAALGVSGLPTNAIKIKYNANGSLSIILAKDLVDKIQLNL
jgi:hypothetical protein